MSPDDDLIDSLRADAIAVVHDLGSHRQELARFLSELAHELADINRVPTPEALQLLYTALMEAVFAAHRHEVGGERMPASQFDSQLGPLLSRTWYAYGADREARRLGPGDGRR